MISVGGVMRLSDRQMWDGGNEDPKDLRDPAQFLYSLKEDLVFISACLKTRIDFEKTYGTDRFCKYVPKNPRSSERGFFYPSRRQAADDIQGLRLDLFAKV